jgi:hypothetical protein
VSIIGEIRMSLSKVEFKKQLQKLGIKIIKGNYVKKSDIDNILGALTLHQGAGESKSFDTLWKWAGKKGRSTAIKMLHQWLENQSYPSQITEEIESIFEDAEIKGLAYLGNLDDEIVCKITRDIINRPNIKAVP